MLYQVEPLPGIEKKDGKFYWQHCDLGQVEFLRSLRLVTKSALSLQNYDMGLPLIWLDCHLIHTLIQQNYTLRAVSAVANWFYPPEWRAIYVIY